MSQTKVGAQLAVATMKRRYGNDYLVSIGKVGGKVKVPKGFSKNRELASIVGTIGGRISRRPKRTQ